jgi:DNA primase
MIPQETIEQVRQSSDIVQIISEYLRLKKRGKNYQTLCPFHTEKTPSFNVSVDKQIYHCFGCGKGGNVITFLMEHEKMSFVDAVKHLAKRANIVIKDDFQSDYKREQFDRIYYANQVAVEYYQQTLKQSKYKDILENYLTYKRHIKSESIDHFKLGLAGEEWEGLIKYAATKDIKPDELENAGLALKSEKTGKYFDRFRHRLMIPILNLSGKTIAFGGRTLKKGEPAKYINSPETALYNKSNILYGLNWAKDDIRESGEVYIVEGYFDVISLWQVGIENVAASSGTAFTQQQARLLARFANTVYLFFDADSAGKKAALRSVDSLYDAGLEVKIIVAPEGDDPDSIAHKHGRNKIEELKSNAIGFIPFRIADFDNKSAGIIEREKIIKEISTIGSKINDPTRRSLFYDEASNLLGVDQNVLQQAVSSDKKSDISSPPKRQKLNVIETEFLSLLLNNPGIIDEIVENISPDDFDSKELSRLYLAIVEQYNTDGLIDAKRLMDNANDERFISIIAEIASINWQPEQIESETKKLIKQMVSEKRKRQVSLLKKELAKATSEKDHEKAKALTDEIKGLNLDAN